MKKIKLIVSDLHIGSGKARGKSGVNTLEEFYYDDKFAEFINYYTTGDYADAEVELILNGDIFNLLQVDFRGHYLSVITEFITLEKLKSVVKGHSVFFNTLRKFAQNEKNIITYIVGNHDQGMLWPAAREYINEVVGANIRYRNMVYYFDGVHIEHGHMHENANRLDPKKFFIKKNIAEPILNLPFGSVFFVEFVLRIKLEYEHIDKVRPFPQFVKWLFVQNTLFAIKTISRCFWFLVRSVFTDDKRRRLVWKDLLKIVFGGNVFPNLSSAARQILNDERVNTVIFGHSHVYQYRQLDENKRYINTGTWTELTSLDMASFGKITKLTYVLLEYTEESIPVPTLKEWRGYHRIEADVDVT